MGTRFTFFLFTILLWCNAAQGQTAISGKVSDKKGDPLPGANVFLKGTFDGATSDASGNFKFQTDEEGDHILAASFIGFNAQEQPVTIGKKPVIFNFTLGETINKMDGVVITAGAFEASDEKKGVVLKPLDIAMTAGATADISAALNTLPGTQKVGESGRLFVRGGESHETKVFVDGLQVNNFFGISAPNTPARGRFSPFLFKGTTFSTGGYSAEYGQALSSALLLNTNDFPEENRTDINLMSLGIGAAQTKIWNKTSVTAEATYINLAPHFSVLKQKFEWEKAPESGEASFVFRQKIRGNGLVKVFGNFNKSALIVNQDDVNEPGNKNRSKMGNEFYYINASYRDILGKKWHFAGGSSIGITKEDIQFNTNFINDSELNLHSKAVLTNDLNPSITLRLGAELLNDVYSQRFRETEQGAPFKQDFNENLSVAFVESDIYLSNKFVFRGGARAERSHLLDKNNIAPRLSLAYKTGSKGQFSVAYGEFFQSPQKQFMKLNQSLDYAQASHYIINYQHIHEDRIFRVEAYRKTYGKLIKFDQTNGIERPGLNTGGSGYANGVDLFIRDRKTIKNGDFWISYSLLDSERDQYDYPSASKVSLFSTHNLSLVYKHFLSSIRTQVGATWNFSSGRPYHDPNLEGFMNSETPAFKDLSFNAAFLYKPNVVLYVSATNLLGFENIFGYQFSDLPDADGVYAKQAIGQPAPRFVFLGLFITLTKDKKLNQLENLN